MIVYKWVIKKNNKYFPIVNNGAYKPFQNLDLSFYEKGKTIKNFINPYKLILDGNEYKQKGFHRTGYHFWKQIDLKILERYNRCMKTNKINCTLKCYIRHKDIIKEDENRIIAKKFRILGEIK